MRWTARVLAACVVFAAGLGSAQAPVTKLALVIGNADYNGDGRVDASATGIAASEAAGFVPDLRNPLNDASDIRDALVGVGFRVDLATNADGATMSSVLAAFGTKVAAAPDDAQVVIYYAGHAIQVDGANFLIPVGARLPAADFAAMPTNQVQTILRRVAVSTTEISEQLKQLRAPGANLLIFDACRNNPWEERVRGFGRSATLTRGLAEIAAPPRTIIVFATAPGHTASDGGGRNSPFSGALKERLSKPGTVVEMLDSVGADVQSATGGRQTPWWQLSSIGQVCLAACVAPPMPRITTIAPSPSGNTVVANPSNSGSAGSSRSTVGSAQDAALLRQLDSIPPGENVSVWAALAKPLVVRAYDQNHSGNIDSAHEARAIPCGVIAVASMKAMQANATQSLMRAQAFMSEEDIAALLGFRKPFAGQYAFACRKY